MKKTMKIKAAAVILALSLLLPGCAGEASVSSMPSSSSASPAPSSQEQAPPPSEELSPLQDALRQFPTALTDDRISRIYPIRGDSDGFLFSTASNTQPGALFYCYGETGETALLHGEFPAWDLSAGVVFGDTLLVVSPDGVFQWGPDGTMTQRPFPDGKQFNFTYNFPRNQLFWVDNARSDLRYGDWDDEGTVLWASVLEENTGPYPSIDEEGNRVAVRASAPVFSGSGRLMLFTELPGGYQQRPVLYDLETGSSWAAEESTSAPAGMAYMLGETGVLTGFSNDPQKNSRGWNRVGIVTMEGLEEAELDFFYTQCFPGETALCLLADDGLYRWDAASRQSEMIYRTENPQVYVNDAVSTSKFDAILLMDVHGAKAVALLPAGAPESGGSAPAVK